MQIKDITVKQKVRRWSEGQMDKNECLLDNPFFTFRPLEEGILYLEVKKITMESELQFDFT